MFERWSRLRFLRGGFGAPVAGPAGPAAAERTTPCRPGSVPAPSAEEDGPIFEGGGGVLLHPSFWEKAGWGIVALAALAPMCR
jgi:hypothetical protein